MASQTRRNLSLIGVVGLLCLLVEGKAYPASVSYTYDSLNRITQVQYGTGTTINYTYDAAGNRLTQVVTVPPQNFLLTVTEPVNGTVTGSGISCPGDCTESYADGTNVLLTANPIAGYQVDTWTGCQSVNGNDCTVEMTQDRNVSVTFTPIIYVLTVSPVPTNGNVTATGINCGTGGTGDCSESYNSGADVTLTGNPAAGFQLGTWSGCTPINNSTQCTVSMTQARTVSMTFTQITYLLTVTSPVNGTVTGSGVNCPGDCTETYGNGTSVLLTADPTAGYQLGQWTGCDSVNGNQCTVQMTQATTVSVTFNLIPDTTPPSLAITSHTNNQTVNSSPITVSGTASDSGLGNSGISSVTVNGVAASGGTATGSGMANWSRSVPIIAGPNAITVVAKDASLAQNSTTVQINVNLNQPPNGTISSPLANLTVAVGGSVNFQGSGTDPDNHLPLSFSWNFGGGATNSTLQNPGPVTFNSQGTFNVTLTVTDNLGLADPTPATRTITVIPPAAVVFVEPSGGCNGNTPCFSSIQEAIGVVATGGTIRVAQATYRENLLVDSALSFTLEGGWSSNFLTRANNPALTIIDGDLTGDGIGEGSVLTIQVANGLHAIVIVGRFTMQHGNDDEGGGVFAFSTNGGTIDLTLTGNVIRQNKSTNTGAGVGIYAQDAGSTANATLTNNMISGNDATGDGGGIYAFADNNGKVNLNLINNTITDNTSAVKGGGLRAVASNSGIADLTVNNNIVWGNTASAGQDIAIRQETSGSATINASYNDIGDVSTDSGAPGTVNDLGNNVDVDPLFVNFPGGDLHLASGSPAIDVGTSVGAPAADFESDPRPQGPGFDLGADERVAGPLTIAASSPLPGGEVGVGYNTSLGVAGGQSPYTITISAGALRAGLGIVGQSISGTPTQSGKANFTIRVTDRVGALVTKKFTLSVNKAVTITTRSLSGGRLSRSYSAALKAANGVPPYTWSLLAGTMPSGLVFTPSTGTISGVPAVAGSVSLTFQVTDALGGVAQKTLTLTIK
jgi:YD repeat-containing protein